MDLGHLVKIRLYIWARKLGSMFCRMTRMNMKRVKSDPHEPSKIYRKTFLHKERFKQSSFHMLSKA